MKRKLLSIVLALCLTLTLLPTATFAAGSYADTNGHWAEAAIERWSGYGILQGADGKFSPDGTLTRAQMATILSRLLALPEASSYGFTDVAAGDWFADAIDRCAAAGIMQGTGGKAEPNAPITREQAMVMLCRALGIDAVAANLSGYPDGAQVSAYAAGYVAALVQMGIVKGDANGKLNPAGNITRAEIVTIIDRLITVYANVDGAVINAANGGTVLVTAKNVSIANAPEGTKVIAAKGADGLSVNGKPVAAGQTYIVPSSEDGTSYTPGTGTYVPHKHTYTYTDNGDGTHTGVCACGNSTVEKHTIKDGRCVLCRAVLTTDTVASVKNSDGTYTYFETLADAIDAANAGDTVTLVKGAELDGKITIKDGKDITIDLNGREIRHDGSQVFDIYNAKVHFTGTGSIFENAKDCYAPIMVRGSATDTADYTVVTIDENVTLKGDYCGIFIAKDDKNGYGNYGLVVNMKGTIDVGSVEDGIRGFDIYVNGQNTQTTGNVMQINLDGARLKNAHTGIYAAGYAKWTLKNCIIDDAINTAIELRAGEMTIDGGTYAATAAPSEVTPNGNGTTTVGAAVAVVQHTTKLPIDLTIINGTFNGFTSLYQSNAQGNTNEDLDKIVINVTGGTFNATTGGTQAVYSENKTGFLTGGTYSSDPSAYVAEGYIARVNGEGAYVVSEVGTAANPYRLDEFNALTKLPAGRTEIYLNIGDVSLADGDVTIGNKNICDMWTWDRDMSHNVGDILEDGRKVYMVRENDTIYSSNKAGITLYISGSVNDNKEGGLNNKGDGNDPRCVTLSIPDASDVVFTKDFTMNGYFRMNTGWSDGRNLGGAVYNRTVKTVLFNHSTFNGIWIQNGGFGAESLTLDGCTFTAYENKVSANDSNPLWFCNIRSCDVTVKDCIFKASRPIKVVEQTVNGANVTITGNQFDMSLTNSADDESKPKNDAIMFSTITDVSTLGNVVVSGNTVTGATALLTFFQNTAEYPANPSQITMADGATFTVSNNTLNNALLSVKWKSTTEYIPDFVTVTGTPL